MAYGIRRALERPIGASGPCLAYQMLGIRNEPPTTSCVLWLVGGLNVCCWALSGQSSHPCVLFRSVSQSIESGISLWSRCHFTRFHSAQFDQRRLRSVGRTAHRSLRGTKGDPTGDCNLWFYLGLEQNPYSQPLAILRFLFDFRRHRKRDESSTLRQRSV